MVQDGNEEEGINEEIEKNILSHLSTLEENDFRFLTSSSKQSHFKKNQIISSISSPSSSPSPSSSSSSSSLFFVLKGKIGFFYQINNPLLLNFLSSSSFNSSLSSSSSSSQFSLGENENDSKFSFFESPSFRQSFLQKIVEMDGRYYLTLNLYHENSFFGDSLILDPSFRSSYFAVEDSSVLEIPFSYLSSLFVSRPGKIIFFLHIFFQLFFTHFFTIFFYTFFNLFFLQYFFTHFFFLFQD